MFRAALTAGLLGFAAIGPAHAGQFDDLLKHASANTNTIVLIDVKSALASPLAKAEQWAEKSKAGDRGGLGFVPTDAEKVVIFSEVNLTTLTRDFQVGLVKVAHNVPEMRELAAREGGTSDEIAGRLAVLSPRDVYFTTLPGSQFVAMYPADRQYTARYLKAVQAGRTGQLSKYLDAATQKADANTLTIAVDLEDAVDKTMLKLSLAASPSVAKVKTVDVELLATFLSGVKGMTFSTKVTDKIVGNLTFEFAGEPARFSKTLPDLCRELLEGQGVAIPGFENWETKFTNNTMTLTGTLSSSDVKRILSLFAFPQLAGETDSKVKGDEPSVSMTKRYLMAVDAVLNDIRSMKDSPNYDKMATWHDKAADQIDHLSRRNVDPIASDAAFACAQRLRAIAQSLRGVPIDKKSLESQQYYYWHGGGRSVGVGAGWWGWRPYVYNNPTYVNTNIPKIQAEIAKVIAGDQKLRLELWSEIDRILQEARRKLGDKYKTDF